MNEKTLESRITGAVLGLACGDALGAPAEFKSQSTVKATWGTLTEMVGGGIWKPGEWTDDTGMALCIAEAILSNPDEPIHDAGGRFLSWQKTSKDVGSTISAALGSFRGDWAQAAQSTHQAKSGKAAGNGSLMRTLPVALAYPVQQTMLRMSARFSSMTHWDAQAEVCCAIYCLWIEELLHGASLRDGWQTALEAAKQVVELGSLAPDTVGPESLPAGFWERLEAIESKCYEDLQPSGYAGYVVECLEAAVWCCLHSESLEQCLVQAVNLAGEADTIAAVAGGAVGAYWGAENIPQRWLDALYQREYLDKIAGQLYSLRQHLTVYATRNLPPFNADWVIDRIMAGRNPLTVRDVEYLVQQGITHIVDLREPHEWAAPKFGADALEEIQRCGLQRLHLPVVDMGAPTAESLNAACQHFDEILKNGHARIYVHCRAGEERTAAVLIAYYASTHGAAYDEALAKLREQRSRLKPMPHQATAVQEWLKVKAKG